MLDGAESPFLVSSSYNDFCLDANLNNLGQNGSEVHLWEPLAGVKNQMWH